MHTVTMINVRPPNLYGTYESAASGNFISLLAKIGMLMFLGVFLIIEIIALAAVILIVTISNLTFSSLKSSCQEHGKK